MLALFGCALDHASWRDLFRSRPPKSEISRNRLMLSRSIRFGTGRHRTQHNDNTMRPRSPPPNRADVRPVQIQVTLGTLAKVFHAIRLSALCCALGIPCVQFEPNIHCYSYEAIMGTPTAPLAQSFEQPAGSLALRDPGSKYNSLPSGQRTSAFRNSEVET